MTTKEQLISELWSLANMCLDEIRDVDSGCIFVAITDLRHQLERIESLNDRFYEEQELA